MFFPAITPTERLLTAGAYLASVKGFDSATVSAAAAEVDISPFQARALFPTAEVFERGLLDYLEQRMRSYVTYDPADTPIDRLCSIAEGTFNLSQSEKHCFNALISRPWPDSEHPFEVLVDEATVGITDPLWNYKRTAFVSLSIGFAHIAAFGQVRLLLPMVKRQLLRGIMRMVRSSFKTQRIENFGPHEPTAIPAIPASDCDVKTLLFQAAIEQYWHEGPDGLTLDASVRRAGIDVRALRLFDGDVAFIRELEDYIDGKAKEALLAELDALPESATAAQKMKALAIGYVNFSVHDPQALSAMTFVSSGSIVPAPIADDFRNYDTFAILMRLVEQAIIELGGSANQWSLFEQTIAAWSYGHGAGFLASQGFWKQIPEEARWACITGSVECIIAGLGPEYFDGADG